VGWKKNVRSISGLIDLSFVGLSSLTIPALLHVCRIVGSCSISEKWMGPVEAFEERQTVVIKLSPGILHGKKSYPGVATVRDCRSLIALVAFVCEVSQPPVGRREFFVFFAPFNNKCLLGISIFISLN